MVSNNLLKTGLASPMSCQVAGVPSVPEGRNPKPSVCCSRVRGNEIILPATSFLLHSEILGAWVLIMLSLSDFGVIAVWQITVKEKGISKSITLSKSVVLEDEVGSSASLNHLVWAYLHDAILIHSVFLFCKVELTPKVLVSQQFLTIW